LHENEFLIFYIKNRPSRVCGCHLRLNPCLFPPAVAQLFKTSASLQKCVHFLVVGGPSSVVGIATGYGLDGPGIESRWKRDFPHLSRLALGPTQPLVQWVPGFSRGVKSGRGVTLTPHPLLVPWSIKGRAIPLLSLLAVRPVQSLSACIRVYFTLPFLVVDVDCHSESIFVRTHNVF